MTGAAPVEVQVVQDRDVILTELFPDAWLAERWATAYCDQLRKQGWHDSPAQSDEDGCGDGPQQHGDD